MNALHIFGDSFSEPIKSLFEMGIQCKRLEYSKRIHNTDYYPIWSEILAQKLGFEHRNFASTSGHNFQELGNGNSNQSILFNLHEECKNFKRGDIVIIGFTGISRFPWPHKISDGTDVHHTLPNQPREHLSKDEQLLLDKLTIHRFEHQDYYFESLFQQLKSFEVLSEIVGFDLYYWGWDTDATSYKYHEKINDKKWPFIQMFPNYGSQYHRILEEYGGYTIQTETDMMGNMIEDAHMGKKANEIHADLFFKYITNKTI